MSQPSPLAELESAGYAVDIVESHLSITRNGVEVIRLPLGALAGAEGPGLPADILDRD